MLRHVVSCVWQLQDAVDLCIQYRVGLSHWSDVGMLSWIALDRSAHSVSPKVPSVPMLNPMDFVTEILVTAAVLVALIFLWQRSVACFERLISDCQVIQPYSDVSIFIIST